VEEELREAKTYPIVLMSIEHDGFSKTPLPKKVTNRGRQKANTDGGKAQDVDAP
jgi:hypothetical protein